MQLGIFDVWGFLATQPAWKFFEWLDYAMIEPFGWPLQNLMHGHQINAILAPHLKNPSKPSEYMFKTTQAERKRAQAENIQALFDHL